MGEVPCLEKTPIAMALFGVLLLGGTVTLPMSGFSGRSGTTNF